MPYAWNHGVRIYWEEEGRGDPLLMIMGLGYSLHMWRSLRPLMAQHFRAILFDNRGVGASDVPWRRYSIRSMAQDAACVLDAAGVASAHVLGMSMGGMIAQELAINDPQRVRRLVLGCTSCGGPHSVRAEPEVSRALMPRFFVPREARMAAIVPYIYDPHTPPERIEADRAVARKHFPNLPGFLAQLFAIIAWDCYERLPQIKAPTLVIHGETDRLVPPGNARILASRIPGAKLVTLPNASHIFPTDQPEASVAAILDFLKPPAVADG